MPIVFVVLTVAICALAIITSTKAASAQQWAQPVQGNKIQASPSFEDFVAQLIRDGARPYRVCHPETSTCEIGYQLDFADRTAVIGALQMDASDHPFGRWMCSRNSFADTTKCMNWDYPDRWHCNMKDAYGRWTEVACTRVGL